jgi:type IV secretion system protein VirB5
LQQALAQEALANASGRFASIQSLVAAISTAGDQKAILDLQARISAELGMLQNEQTKLQILHLATQAQESVNRQQEREEVIAGHGRFASRFQPVPAASTTTR